MFKKFLPWYLLALVVLSLAFIYGCGSSPTGGGGGTSGRHYYGVTSMGDTVRCTITNTTFSFTIAAGPSIGKIISGNITTLESGFLSLEVTGTTLTDVPVGSHFAAFEITGEVFAMAGAPQGSSGHDVIIICPALSSTAPSACTAEGIMIPMEDWLNNTVACLTTELKGSDPYTFEAKLYNVDGDYLDSTYEAGYSFTGGRLYKSDIQPQLFFSPKGLFAGNNGKRNSINWDDGGIVGTVYDSTVSTLEIADGRRYIGMSFERGFEDDNTYVEAISVESTGVNTLNVSSMEVSDGTIIGDPRGTITLLQMDVPAQGIIDATINPGDPDIDIAMKMVAYKYNDDGKYALCGFVSLEESALSFFVIEP